MILLKRSVFISLICINLLAAVFISFLLNRGLEPSDTGHYYSALFHLEHIKVMTTQFAVIWSLLPLPNEILFHRIVLYLTFSLGCLLFAFKSRAFIFNNGNKLSILATLVLISVSFSGMATSYRVWLPDPNYNLLAQIMMLVVMACAFHLCINRFAQGLKNNLVFALLGCLLLFLFLIRPPSGLATLLIVIALFLFFLSNRIPQIFSIVIFMTLGGLLGLILIALVVESPLDTFSRLQQGLIKRDLLSFNSGLKSHGTSYFIKLFESTFANMPSIILAVVGVSLVPLVNLKVNRSISARNFLTLSILGEVLVIISIILMFYQLIENRKGYLLILSIILMIISLGNALQCKDEFRKLWIRIAAFCGFGFLLSISSVIGTVGSLMEATHTKANIFIFFSVGIVVVALMHHKKQWLISVFLLVITGAGSLHSLKNTVERPYRLPASLIEQKHLLSDSTIGAHMKVDKQSLEFFSAFYKAQTYIKTSQSKPVLIDLTGRMPLIQSFIGAKPARTPWLLSQKSGSNNFFSYIVDLLSEEELNSAWILYAPEYDHGLDISILNNKGVNLNKDYDVVADTFSPMLKKQVQLFKPKIIINTN